MLLIIAVRKYKTIKWLPVAEFPAFCFNGMRSGVGGGKVQAIVDGTFCVGTLPGPSFALAVLKYVL